MTYWAIDAGGTTTTAALSDGSRMRRGSVNPASVGAAGGDTLADLFRQLARHLGGQPSTGWLATASVGLDTPSAAIDRLAAASRAAGLTGTLVVSGDVPPLLLAPPLAGRGIVIVAGTGSAVVASARPDDGLPVVVGGCEYLGSDEGSAYALGLAGLRAAVRAADGRGPATSLFASAGPRELARRLAGEPFPKAAVAALAPQVCTAWRAGDPVAQTVVRAGLDDLVTAVRAGRDAAGLDGQWSAVLNGGVFRGCSEYAAALGERVVDELGAAGPITVVTDPVAAVLAAAVAHADRPPKGWAQIRTL